MKIYLSGKMRGLPDLGHAAFAEAAKTLRAQGHTVISPSEMDEIPTPYTIKDEIDLVTWERGYYYPDQQRKQNEQLYFARRDIQALLKCDAIALIPGWKTSMGAKAEKAVAEWVGLKVIQLA